ncbi:MAG: hemerythrin domain-containing protein [Fidelibacterota bacterium]
MTQKPSPPPSSHKPRPPLLNRLPQDHLIATLMREHQDIVKLLDRLRTLTEKLDSLESPQDNPGLLDRLSEVTENLLEVELHHDREEKILFPALEKQGITDSPYVLKEEHQILRDMKTKFLEALSQSRKKDFPAVKARLGYYGRSIDRLVRKHIETENTVLFPAALQAIQDETRWKNLKAESEKLGKKA